MSIGPPVDEPVGEPVVVWTRFLVAMARLFYLAPLREEAAERGRVFAPWRVRLLDALGDKEAVSALSRTWGALLSEEYSSLAARLLLEELEAFSDYVGQLSGAPIAPVVQYPEDLEGITFRALDLNDAREGFSIAGTIADSARDLLEKLPFKWKALLKGLSEAADIWKALC